MTLQRQWTLEACIQNGIQVTEKEKEKAKESIQEEKARKERAKESSPVKVATNRKVQRAKAKVHGKDTVDPKAVQKEKEESIQETRATAPRSPVQVGAQGLSSLQFRL